MIWLLAVIGVAWIFILIHNIVFSLRLEWLTESTAQLKSAPSVSIVVPARNEADIIERSLSSLLHLDYPDFEVILVDDQSVDGTAEIAATMAATDSKLSVITGDELPSGWVGKSWALHQGVSRARGEWLLFTDADCIHHPQSLRAAMGFACDRQKDFVSMIPALERVNFAEKLVRPAFITILGTFFSLARINRHPRRALVAGAFILVKRSVYEAVGGHTSIAASIVDDLSLAHLIKASGASAWTVVTRDLVLTRQYHSLKDVWEGLSKHGFALMKRSVARALVFGLGVLLMVSVPVVGLGVGLFAHHWAVVGLSASSLAVIVLLGIGCAQMLNIRMGWALFLPIGLLLYMLIVIHSMVQALRGKLVWSGRHYGR